VKALMGYDFPGNIRELQNMVERGVISAEEGGVIDLPHMVRKEQLGGAGLLHVNAGGALAAGEGGDAPSQAAAAALPTPGEAHEPGLFDRLADPATQTLDLEALERRLMAEVVARTGQNLSAAARLLGLTRAQLAYRLRNGA
jgi:DNA-binding NtrC family response regulator